MGMWDIWSYFTVHQFLPSVLISDKVNLESISWQGEE
jgi:hypothetical protein